LRKASKHEVGEGELHTPWCFDPLVFQALRSQWLITPCKVVEIPYLWDKDPNTLGGQMQASKISPS